MRISPCIESQVNWIAGFGPNPVQVLRSGDTIEANRLRILSIGPKIREGTIGLNILNTPIWHGGFGRIGQIVGPIPLRKLDCASNSFSLVRKGKDLIHCRQSYERRSYRKTEVATH